MYDHESQYVGHCVLRRKGTPISFYTMEEFISDTFLERKKFGETPKKGMTATFIGSGPVGLTVSGNSSRMRPSSMVQARSSSLVT